MEQFTVDDHLADALLGLGGPVELVDAAGRRVGRFEPSYAGEPDPQSPTSDAELRRRRLDRNGRPLADILRDLERA